MKTRFIYLLTTAALFFTWSSCKKDFLDNKIDTQNTDQTLATNSGTLFNFGNAFYTSLPYGFNVLDNNLFDAATDDAQQIQISNSNALIFNQGILSQNLNLDLRTSNNNKSPYRVYYDGIRAANFFLNYSKDYKKFLTLYRDVTTDPTNYNRDVLSIGWYRGEAHIAKAYYYMELAKRYGGVPIIEKTFQDGGQLNVSKSSYQQVVDYVVSEVDKYKDSLQVNWKTATVAPNNFSDQDGRFSKAAALAIKSRMLLYAASPLNNPANDVTKWQAAAAAARDVMTTAGLNLSLNSSYQELFRGNTTLTSNETILAVRRGNGNLAEGNNPERINYPIGTAGGGGAGSLTPTHNLVEAYEYIGTPDATDIYKNRDPRLAASIVTNGSSWNGRTIDISAGGVDDPLKANTSRTGYYLKKYLQDNLNLQQGGAAYHHWILFRYAETLLNYAEAMNEAYGPDAVPAGFTLSAKQALKAVRDRASTSLPAITTSSVASFRDIVKHERRIELAFEDHRYWDLLRWKDAQTVLNQPIKGVKATKTGTTFTYQIGEVATRKFDNRMYLFPFSQAEITNSNGTIAQNTGY